MNKVVFIPAKPPNRRLKAVAVLILIAAFPLSSGLIFRSSCLSWVGITLIGVACLWGVIEELCALILPWPRYRLVQVNSKPMLDEFLRLGWTLREAQPKPTDNEPREFLLEWLREEDPPPPDLSKLSQKSTGDVA
jgi:hypothetical protein